MTERRDPIRVVPYDPAWPSAFEREAARVRPLLEPYLTGPVEHIGSTAVPGLAAKPIIDMVAVVRSYDDAAAIAAALQPLGWAWAPEPQDDELRRASFCFPDPGYRSHHLHAIEDSSPHWRRWIAFRDALRAEAALAGDYAALKTQLARDFAHERDRYRSGKSAFVAAVLHGRERRRLP